MDKPAKKTLKDKPRSPREARAESALYHSNRRLEALLNALPVGVNFSEDTTCEVITGNPAMLKMLGLNPGDNISASTSKPGAPGRKLRHFMNGREVDPSRLPMQRAIVENREVGPMEIEALLPSGRRWVMEAIAAPIRDESGKPIASVAVNVDLTHRKRAEEADRLERIVEEERVKMDFIADAAHELRTPLAIIKGNVDLALRAKKEASPAMRETLHAIDDEVVHLGNLLGDLTILISNESEFQRKVASGEVSIVDVLETAVKRHKSFAADKRVEIRMKKIADVSVRGDRTYLERAFSNIITNAISYGRDGGYVEVSAAKAGKNVRVDISDDGIGIPKKDLPHIFERFYRVEGSRSKDHGGTGLGLAIVERIVTAHGGTVTAKSSGQGGSTFTITLPLI